MKKTMIGMVIGVVLVSYVMFTLSKDKLATLERELQDLQDQKANLKEEFSSIETQAIFSSSPELIRKKDDKIYRRRRVEKRIAFLKKRIAEEMDKKLKNQSKK